MTMSNGIGPSNESWLDSNAGMILKIGVFILLLVIILLSTGYMKKIMVFVNPDLENCKGGTCKTSCIKGSELQQQGIKCADTSKVCCMPDTHTVSPECNSRSQGEPCGEVMLCDEYSTCISRCEYCSIYPTDKSCKIEGMVGKAVTEFDSTFSCGCTDMDCITFDNSRMGTCVKGFCPSNNPVATDYMCCSTLYKR
jgi:hypothetical protein